MAYEEGMKQRLQLIDANRRYRKTVDESLTDDQYDDLIRWLAELESRGIQVVTSLDQTYPEALYRVETKPDVLYLKGSYLPTDQNAIAVIGSRSCSDYGISACKRLVRELASEKICVVSGMAYGVDGVAHKVAIEEGTRTIAVLGCGIDVLYPKTHGQLFDMIVENGCVMTEFPPKSAPLPQNFRQRNRIISGLSQGVLVVEARRKSGTMITTSYAAEQGVDVFAIPGNIDQPKSEGTNELIQMGAKLVMSAEDILKELPALRMNAQLRMESVALDLTNEARIVYDTLRSAPMSVAQLMELTGMRAEVLLSTIALLELEGWIDRVGADRYAKR